MAPPLSELQATLADRYELERELGRGGMATVYLAHDLRHDRPVALKVLRAELSDVLGAERFSREIALAARLSHPHILPIYDSGTLQTGLGGPVLYYTMPYVAGKSVRDRLEAEPQLPVEEAVRIARQVAEALEHAHEQGVIHRDIKPENILLTGSPSRDRGGKDAPDAMVADFGIARTLEAAARVRLTETGLVLGTPAYMSPEQGTGSTRLDGRTDVYALGCVLYEMLAGQAPFTGPTPQAVLARHAMDPVPSIRTVRSTVSEGLSRVVNRALAKVPADRYPTAGAFAEALAVPGVGTTHETVTVLTPVWNFGRRRRALIAAGVGLLVLVAIAVATTARSREAKLFTVDPALVAVAPFRVAAADSSLAYLREGMVDLLASKLGGTLALRLADPRASLGAWRRAAGGGDLTETAALAAAGQLGAGRLVQGEVVGDRGHVTLSAVLVEVPGGRPRARASVEGPSDSLTSLVNQLAARLLSLTADEPADRLAALAAVPLPTLRAYLDGQVLLRRGEPFPSLKRFQDALAGDSGFALAALGAVRANFEGQPDRNSAEARAAWRLRNLLSPRDQSKLDVLLGAAYSEQESAADAVATAERYTQLVPDDPDAWYLYGVRLCSSGSMLGLSDAMPRCKSAYGRAWALDSGSTLIVMNYTAVAAALRDSDAMKQGLRALLRTDSASPGSVFVQWKVATMLGDKVAARQAALSDSMITTRAGWTRYGPWALMSVFLNEGVGLHDLERVLERALADASTGTQRGNLVDLQLELGLIRGRSTGVPLPDFWLGARRETQRVIDALFADGDPAAAAPEAQVLEREVGTPIGTACCLDRFVAGESALKGGRITAMRRALSDLERVAGRDSDTAAGAVLARAYAAILAAQLSARERRPSAAEQLRVLDSMLTDPRGESVWVPLLGNLIAARLHEERREFPQALAAIRRRDEGAVRPVYVTYHREEGRIAAEAGDTVGAIRAYRRYLRIRAEAEPRLQPEVQRVRAELAAIERVSASR